MRRARVGASALACLAILSQAACDSPRDRLRDRSERLASEAASIAFVAGLWTAHRVPRAYVRVAAQGAREAIARGAMSLRALPDSASPDRARAVLEADALARAVSGLDSAATRGDLASGARLGSAAYAQSVALRGIARRAGSSR